MIEVVGKYLQTIEFQVLNVIHKFRKLRFADASFLADLIATYATAINKTANLFVN